LPEQALVATAYQHGVCSSAEFKIKSEFAKLKTLKSEQKGRMQREDHEGWAGRVKKLPKAGGVKNGIAGL
jgi:hypothetical protein